jgi:glycosyltransferase involved in cell wall biosynthesis
LVSYKQIDYAVKYFRETKRPLKIVGRGPEYLRLKTLAGPNIEFCGHVGDTELRDLYAHCRAVIIPGEEDFGIVAVEALASGKAVIALGRGGVLESAADNEPKAGFFYREPAAAYLQQAIKTFEFAESDLHPGALQAHAASFSELRFQSSISKVLFEDNRVDEGNEQALSVARSRFTAA